MYVESNSQDWTERRRLQVQLLVIVALGLSSFMASFIIYPTLPLYVLEMGSTKLELGLILSIASITTVLTRIPLGALSDRVGTWNFVSFSMIGHSLSNFLYLAVPNAAWLYPLRAFHAAAIATFNPITVSIASGLVGREHRGRVLGIYLTTPAASMMIGPALNSYLIERGGYLLTFLVAGLLPLAGFVLCILARRLRIFEKTASQALEAKHSSSKASTLFLLKNLVTSRAVVAISIARTSFSTTDGIFGTIFAIHVVQNLSLPPHMIGLFFAVMGIANTSVRWPIGLFCDRVGGKRPAILAFILTGLSFLILSETQSLALVTLAMLMTGLAWGTRAITEWALIANLPGGSTAIATSYLSTLFDLGEAIGAFLGGAFMIYLPFPSIFKISAAIVIAGVIPLTAVKIKKE
mgnify:CR=1 FL=1